MENYAAIKDALPASVEAGGTAVIGVDDRYTRAAADRIERAGKNVVRVSVQAPLRDGYYAQGHAHPCARRRQGGRRGAISPASARLRGQHNAQNAACAIAACVALGVDLRGDPEGPRELPRPCAPHAADRPQGPRAVRQRLRRRPTPTQRPRRWRAFDDIFWIAGGKPKTGGITSLAEFFPRIRKAYLIGEAAEEFAATLDGKVPYEIAGMLSAAVDAAARDADAVGAEGAGGAAVAGLRLVRPVPQFRGARRRPSPTWCWRCQA